MQKLILVAGIIMSSVFICTARVNYDEYFTKDRMRLDMVMTGNSTTQSISLTDVSFEENWSGTRKNLIYPFDYGDYKFEAFDLDSGKLIFSFGFCTLFSEWRTTDEAVHTDRAFPHSFRMPWPKQPVRVVFSARRFEDGKMEALSAFVIDPADMSINRGEPEKFEVVTVQDNGPVEEKVDILFVAEGYTSDEMPKFLEDVRRMTEYLFTMEPYRSRRADFNVRAVKSVSKESGTDIPHHGIWKNTIVDSRFYTFKIDRYLTVSDQTLIAKLAAGAPCDALYVIVNTDKYGGGGIYNSYGLCASDSRYCQEVMIHEFGHSFAGLGDEYYESEVAYNDMYNLKVECWEPNITTLVDFKSKWQDMVGSEGVGVHEGGGYAAKGIFRPREECRMKSNHGAEDFCPVCRRAIDRMIDYFCK